VENAIFLQGNGGRLGAGIVMSHNFEVAAIAGGFSISSNYAVAGLLFGANAAQS
jgi:hypothetical protein